MSKPLMAKATAVWLVDNTTLTFRQVADFCGLHELEVQGIADGDVATRVKGFDPVSNNQLDAIEIDRAQTDPMYRMNPHAPAPDGHHRPHRQDRGRADEARPAGWRRRRDQAAVSYRASRTGRSQSPLLRASQERVIIYGFARIGAKT